MKGQKGTHAPSLRTVVAATMRREIAVERGARVVCACSGGPDSTALLDVLASLRDGLSFELHAHGVDHGLREEAARELAVAAALAARLDVSFTTTSVRVERGGNVMARARAARYAALREAARGLGGAYIATAHTADDRAETVLLRLLRGSGARGLAVLPPRSEDLLRPMVRASRAAVTIHLQRRKIVFAEDPSNLDVRFARVRVRHEVLPLLAAIAPRIVATLNHLADELSVRRAADDDPLAALSRSQRQAIREAFAQGKEARVRVGDREEVWISPPRESAREAASGATERPVAALKPALPLEKNRDRPAGADRARGARPLNKPPSRPKPE